MNSSLKAGVALLLLLCSCRFAREDSRVLLIKAEEADPRNYPGAVALLAFDAQSSATSLLCSGTRVAKYTYMTAAHCIYRSTNAALVRSFHPGQRFAIQYGADSHQELVTVNSFDIHLQYYDAVENNFLANNPALDTSAFDVGFIKIQEDLPEDEVEIAQVDLDELFLKDVHLAGFGKDENGKIGVFRAGPAEIVKKSSLFYVMKSLVQQGEGDSGGGVYWLGDKNILPAQTVIGINSRFNNRTKVDEVTRLDEAERAPFGSISGPISEKKKLNGVFLNYWTNQLNCSWKMAKGSEWTLSTPVRLRRALDIPRKLMVDATKANGERFVVQDEALNSDGTQTYGGNNGVKLTFLSNLDSKKNSIGLKISSKGQTTTTTCAIDVLSGNPEFGAAYK